MPACSLYVLYCSQASSSSSSTIIIIQWTGALHVVEVAPRPVSGTPAKPAPRAMMTWADTGGRQSESPDAGPARLAATTPANVPLRRQAGMRFPGGGVAAGIEPQPGRPPSPSQSPPPEPASFLLPRTFFTLMCRPQLLFRRRSCNWAATPATSQQWPCHSHPSYPWQLRPRPPFDSAGTYTSPRGCPLPTLDAAGQAG